jgi:hypothetical protein
MGSLFGERTRYAVLAAALLAFLVQWVSYPTSAQPQIRLTAFPAPGTLTDVAGTVTGLPGGSYKAVLYLEAGNGAMWIKPQPGSSAPLDAGGNFRFTNWAAYPPGDVNFVSLRVYIVPATAPTVSILGGPAPSQQQTGALVIGNFPRGTTAGGTGGGVVPPPTTPTGPTGPTTPTTPTSPTGGATVTLTAPALGQNGAISGRVTGGTGNMVACILVRAASGGLWGCKPGGMTLVPVGGDGSFQSDQWAAGVASDLNAPGVVVYILPAGTVVAPILGVQTPPPGFTSAAIATAEVIRTATGSTPTSPGGTTPTTPTTPTGPTTPTTPTGGGATLTFTAPQAGTTNPITGRVTGLAIAGHTIAVYLSCANGNWGSKPGAASTHPINPDGSFSVYGWSSAATDAACPSMTLIVLPPGVPATPVLGAPSVPTTLLGASLASATAARGQTSSGTGPAGGGTGGGGTTPTAPTVAPPPPPGGVAGEIPYPPADAGQRINPAGGFINFAGYRWIVKGEYPLLLQ